MTAKQRKERLAETLRANKAQHDADQAEYERLSSERHAIFLEGFRDLISRDDRFTEEENADIIKASHE